MLIASLLFYLQAIAQEGGLEQYYFFGDDRPVSIVSIAYYESAKNWYGELRYNYEEEKTLSLNAGKSFYGGDGLAFSFTPEIGLLLGRFNGLSTGASMEATLDHFNLSLQLEYLISVNDKYKNFVLNWSEISYQASQLIKCGLVLQQTILSKAINKSEAGVFISISNRKWSFPIYIFNCLQNRRNYAIGINWQWQHPAAYQKHRLAKPIKKQIIKAL